MEKYATSSVKDLCIERHCMNEAGKEDDLHKCAFLDLIPLCMVFEPTQKAFIEKCAEKENHEASYRKGVTGYFYNGFSHVTSYTVQSLIKMFLYMALLGSGIMMLFCFGSTNSSWKKTITKNLKSLELCTESLGSETGSDTSEDDAIFAFPSSTLSVKRSRRDQVESKKVLSRSFPPPLTTMSGSKPFQVRPHREGGRLIIEAMEMSLGNSCLRAERSHGRLLLTCSKSEEDDCDTEREENDMNDVEKDDKEMERNVVVENFQRLRRCNEDEHRDNGICCSWEPSCWVATS
ncbi:protein FANTASTIC FOUR 3 [Lactuca sativa]|uniref:protein FANTASTIC FOUR 3 n=1 Tax=Lactuca sativa TaxID=4236 RepID=UPI001C68B540|nr:protein FANTASTIC FOUR 3 [Lactuca sativa]